jgi:hypothetical protein
MIKYCTLYAMTIGIIAPIGYVICAIIQNKWRKMIDPKANGRPRTRSIGRRLLYQQKAIPSITIVVHVVQKVI